jgi:hypothetical protein
MKPPAQPDPNSPRRLAEGHDATGPDAPRPSTRGLGGFASEHRFRLMMLACALALALMLATVCIVEGFGPVWARPAVPAT